MGIYKHRTDFINAKLTEPISQEDKRLLSVGFIPETMFADYNKFMQDKEIGTDEDIDKISNGNYFSLHHNKIAGEVKAGTGFLNPILVKGTIEDVISTINSTLAGAPTGQVKTESAAKQTIKPKQMKPGNPKADIKPEVDISSKDIQVIVKNNLINDDTTAKTQTTEQIIKKYNPNLTEAEIKAWVYHKRKFGNPMKGWEKYFIAGGKNSNTLLRTTKDTMVKDNKYADLRTTPANTIIGAKTKFHNTYGTESLVICKTATGELVWVNIADVKEVQNVTGESQSAIDQLVNDKALLFDGTEYYPYPVYLFGNIYEKINSLKENKEAIEKQYGAQVYAEQMAKVESYKPKLKSFRDVVKGNRPHILSLSEFANDPMIFGVKELNEETGIKLGTNVRGRFRDLEEKINLFGAFEYWIEAFVKDTDLKNTTRANIKKYYFAKAVKWPKDEDGKDILTSAQKDELIGNARIAAEALFSDFLATALTFEDGVALDVIWNEKYNAFTSVIQFVDQVPIGFDGSTMFKNGQLGVKPAQRQGLAYLQLTGSGCLAYDVGFGKTLTGILNIAQLMSQGAIKRPLVVVPKPTYKNWLKELFGYWTDGEKVEFKPFTEAVYHYGVFSGISNIKVNDWYNLSGKHYEKLVKDNGGDLDKLVAENTITIVSYKGFEQMGFSKNISQDMFDSIARVIMQKEANEDLHQDDKKAAKEKVSFYQKVQGWLGIGNKNSVVNVDTCGFDHLTVDEAHNFKNVFAGCGKDESTGRKLFGLQASQSSRAVKMFFITNYIQAKHGKKVVLLTATPFTNSPLEMYSMLSFIGLETLNNYNLFNIKKFFEQFILQTIEYAVDAKGEIITKPIIKSFQNIKLLQTILYNHFHYKDDPKEAGVVRPCKIDLPNQDINTYLDMNEWQRKNQLMVKAVAKTVSRTNPGAVLKAINMSLNNAFSPYLFDNSEPESAEDFVNNSPKIKYTMDCIKTVKEWHKGRGEESSGIVIYSNRGKEYFDYIKQYLIDNLGFKNRITYDEEVISEVEILTGGGTEADDDRKELIKDAFNAGVVKVIIGTATIREGVNLQSRGTCLFNLYPEWNPTDIVQLKGRIWRQGNKYGYIRFIMPLIINSMDGFLNQKLDEKGKRIANLWGPIGDSNVVENEQDLDPSEIKYALVDDAQEKFKMKYDTVKAEMQRDFDVLNENKKTVSEINYQIDELKSAEERIYRDFSESKSNWADYLKYLQGVNLKKLKEEDLKKTITDIERTIKNLTELLEAFEKYQANRYDIAMFLDVARMVKNRMFEVFTDYSDLGKKIANEISEVYSYRAFQLNDYQYDRLVRSYSVVKKAEKSVLNAYGKSWLDDLSEISKEVDKKIEAVKMQAETVLSEDFKQAMINEIEAEMEAAKQVRGNLEEQVNKFASLNLTLSYLSDNTDKENCPIPIDICCPTHGFTVVHTDKGVPEPINIAPEVDTEARNKILTARLKLLAKMSAKDPKNNTLKTRIKIINKMLEKKMFWGGPIKAPKDWLVVYTRTSGKKADLELSGKDLQTEADVREQLSRRSDIGIYKINSITELHRAGGPIDNSITISNITEGARFKADNGTVFIIDQVKDGEVRTSFEGGAKGNYRDSIEEVVAFLNEEKSVKILSGGGPILSKWVISNKDKTQFITARFNSSTGINKPSWTDNINLANVYDTEVEAIEAEDMLSDFGIHELTYPITLAETNYQPLNLKDGGPVSIKDFKKDAGGNYTHPTLGYSLIDQFDGTYQILDANDEDISGESETLKNAISTINDYHKRLNEMAGGGKVASQYDYWRDIKILGHYEVKNKDIDTIIEIVGFENNGTTQQLYQPSDTRNEKIGSIIVPNEKMRSLQKGQFMLFNTTTGLKVKIKRIAGRYFYDDGRPFTNPKIKQGGPINRPKFASIKDHKYYNEHQEHEVRYAKQHGRKKLRYKMVKGGPVQYADLSKLKKVDMVSDVDVISQVAEIDITKLDLVKFAGKPKIKTSAEAANVFREFWNENSINVSENLNVLFLSRANRPIGIYQHSKGGVSSTVVDVQMISAIAVKTLAQGVIIAHNHPSSQLEASEPDIQITEKLKQALNLFGIRLLDSMILIPNSQAYYSFADSGIMRDGGPVSEDDSTYIYEQRYYTAQELIDFADSAAEYDRRDNAETGEEGEHIETVEQAIEFLGPDEVEILNPEGELEIGIKVEAEHKNTLEKLSRGEITVEQAIKETAQVHLDEDPNYYSKLREIEKK